MDMKDILKRAKELHRKSEIRKNDLRYRKVMGFLVAKGLLIDEGIRPQPNIKIRVDDLLWVAEKIEPRVLEVFPAALLHFPKTFMYTDKIPEPLKKIIEAIRLQRAGPLEYKGIEFKKMKRWADLSLKDQRVRPLSERRVPKNYRLRPFIAEKLKKNASKVGLSETAYLEELILKG